MSIEIAKRVELVLSAPLGTRAEVEKLCRLAIAEKYRSVVIPSSTIVLAQHLLEETPIKLSCRIGFPNGSADSDVKRYETELAIDSGAHEIELMPSLARIADGDFKALLRELRDIAEASDERPVKVAFEPHLWNPEIMHGIIGAVLDSGAQYVCTSTDEESNSAEEIAYLRQLVGPDFGIVASHDGDLAEADELISAGANLISLNSR